MSQAHLPFWPKGLPLAITQPATTLYENLDISAKRFPDKPAMVFYGAQISYRRLKEEVDCMAGYLQQSTAFKAGDRVLLFSQNCPQFIIAYYAILRAEGVVVPVNAMCTPDELNHYLEDSGARIAFVAQELCANLRDAQARGDLDRVIVHTYSDYLVADPEVQAPPWLSQARSQPELPDALPWYGAMLLNLPPKPYRGRSDDLCVLPYTSGTTGRPKGCRHTHRTMGASLAGSQLWRGLTCEAVVMGVAPMFHLLGMQNGMNLPILLGATIVMLPRWDRGAAATLIARHGVSIWAAPPAMIVDFFAQPDIENYDLSRLAVLCGGGAAMPESVSAMLAERYGIIFNEAYGLTETASFLHCNPMQRGKRQCIGVPTFGVDTRVVDPGTLLEMAPGEVGELVTRGEQVMLGYWRNPQADEEAFMMIDGERYFRTGDLGRVDQDGYFFMTDRLKRMINASGYKVWPAEVENALYEHPAVHEACVVGVPDAQRGETVKALLVLKPGSHEVTSAADVIAWARQRMAAYKVPRIVEIVQTLPKSNTGKILWRQLQEAQRASGHKDAA